MILISGNVRLSSPLTNEARLAMKQMIHASRSEAGCVEYAYSVDVLDPQIIRISEQWTSQAALAEHFKTEHMQEWIQFLNHQPLEDSDIFMIEGQPQPIAL